MKANSQLNRGVGEAYFGNRCNTILWFQNTSINADFMEEKSFEFYIVDISISWSALILVWLSQIPHEPSSKTPKEKSITTNKMVNRKRTKNELQNTTQKNKRSCNMNLTKNGGDLRWPGRMSCSYSINDTRWYR
jgi:hypothetical protein